MRAAYTIPLAILLALSPSTLHAQGVAGQPAPILEQPDPPPPALVKPTLPRGRITGSVFCADTRQPARGATVMAMRIPRKDDKRSEGPQMMAHVGTNGAYALEHVSPGDYAVIAAFPGYLSAFDDIPEVAAGADSDAAMMKALAEHGVVTVAAEAAVTNDITLHRGAAISGRVLYSDGSPATQVTISAEDVKAPRAAPKGEASFNLGMLLRTLIIHQTLGTDDLGHFRIAGIKPGTYRIAILQPSTGELGMQDQIGMVFGSAANPKSIRFYSGDTFHQKAAKTYDLRPGDELTGLDIRLPIDGFHSIRGTLSAVDGRSINMGSLTLADTSDDSLTFYTSLALDGSFQFPSIPPGTYTLAVKNAHIGAAPGNIEPEYLSQMALIPTNTFADSTLSLLVKDSDLTGVSLTLTETPMPTQPPPTPPQTTQPD